jgi:hypothetical protein
MKCPRQTRGAGCIIRSALIIGADLPHNDEWTTALLTNPEVIAVDQHSTANPTSTVGSEFFVVFVDKLFVPCNISLSALNSDEYIKYFP